MGYLKWYWFKNYPWSTEAGISSQRWGLLKLNLLAKVTWLCIYTHTAFTDTSSTEISSAADFCILCLTEGGHLDLIWDRRACFTPWIIAWHFSSSPLWYVVMHVQEILRCSFFQFGDLYSIGCIKAQWNHLSLNHSESSKSIQASYTSSHELQPAMHSVRHFSEKELDVILVQNLQNQALTTE